MNPCKLLFLFILFTAETTIFAEVRSLWILPWSLKTPQSIDEVISNAILNNQNELLVEVRYRSDALYKQNRTSGTYYNPEPRSYILSDDGFDPLEYAIQRCHELGLKIQAWVVVFNATPLDQKLINKNYMYLNHKAWLTYTKTGSKMNSKDQFGYFIDPGIPEVQDYLLDVFSDIVEGYPDLDGLHLDYIRYPSSQYGFHPVSLARFEEQKQIEPNLSWNQWRIKQVTTFVEKCSTRIKAINPRIMLTAAVFSSIYDATVGYAQDWYDWLNRGIIDRAYPMAYALDYNAFRDQLQSMKSIEKDDKIVIGLRAWNANGGSLLPIESPFYNIAHINKRIAFLRSGGFAGIALFSYDGIMKKNALSHLAKLSFPQLERGIDEVVHADKSDSVYVSFSIKDNQYVIDLFLPKEGIWEFELYDERDNSVIFHKTRYYLQGHSREYWDGVLSDNNMIDPDVYCFSLSNDVHKISVTDHVLIQELLVE